MSQEDEPKINNEKIQENINNINNQTIENNESQINNENTQTNVYINELGLSKINNDIPNNYQNAINNTNTCISSEIKNNTIEKKKSCKEKCPFCFCKIKCAFFVDFCTKEGRAYYKNKPSKECFCLITFFYYIIFILSEIIFYILYVFFKICKCMPHYTNMVEKNINTIGRRQQQLDIASSSIEKQQIERYYEKELEKNYNEFINNVKKEK